MKKVDVKEEEYSDASDFTVKLLSKSLQLIPSGSVKIDINSLPTAAIFVEQQGKKLSIDLIEPDLLLNLKPQSDKDESDDNISIFDKLKIAKDFAQKLTDNGMTLSILRNGKEAITLGDEASPKFSRIITRSDDIQIDSVIQSSKLKGKIESDDEN